jgi:hypothetical protein
MRGNEENVTLPYEIVKTLLSNYNTQYTSNELTLRPYETLVLEVK